MISFVYTLVAGWQKEHFSACWLKSKCSNCSKIFGTALQCGITIRWCGTCLDGQGVRVPLIQSCCFGSQCGCQSLTINALTAKSLQSVFFQFDQFKFKCSIVSTVFTFCNVKEVTPDWWRVLKQSLKANSIAVRIVLLCFRKCYNWFKAKWEQDLSGRVWQALGLDWGEQVLRQHHCELQP